MVRLGLDSFSYRATLGGMDARAGARWFLDEVLALGLDGCQFDPMHLDGWNEQLVREIGAFCSEHGLYLELGSGGFDFDHLSGRLRLASEVGARATRTFIGWERHKMAADELRQWAGCASESFKRLAGVAEECGVPIALENHEDLTSREIIGILEEVGSPYIRALVDTGNALPVGEDPVECTRNLAPYAAASHLKDWRVRWEDAIPLREGCPLGAGDGRIAEVYAILRDANPGMPLTIECAPVRFDGTPFSPEQEEALVVESVWYARRLGASTPPHYP